MRTGPVVACVAVLLAGCGGSSSQPAISATPRDALIDAPPRIRVSGVDDAAVVRATTVDERGLRWTSTTHVADLRSDPTRPLWTLAHAGQLFLPSPSGYTVRLDLVEDGRSVAHTTIVRRWASRGVRHESVRDGLYGEMFEPPGSGRRAAALVIGGSD